MACIKSVNRSASVALSPDGPYMAAGTMAGAVDLSFSSSASLEILKLDFQTDSQDIPVIGECQSSERFNRVAWGKNGSGSDSYSSGIIAGGLVDGNIGVWNPSVLMRSETNENAFVGQLSSHKGPVRGLEFNSMTPNLLASGADDGEICIWDLTAPAEPSHFPPLKGSGSATQGEISYVSWNSKVQHILASTSFNGITVVWDLKRQKPVISVEDSIRRRCSVLQWHPDVATQLVIASDDDSSPALRLWDMRNTLTPVKEFVGHTKGVIAMSWCPSDSSYLLTCAKDNRTICWDTITGEIVRELPAGTNWNFDVHWYPKIPGVISASSFDGKIGIYNIEGCSRYDDGQNGAVTVKAPKWYERPAGVSFGFGGKLVSFHPGSTGASEVALHNVVTEDSLVGRSSEFESAIQNREKSSLRMLCEKKSHESESEDERETWGFLKVMFEEDGTARTKMLMHLGFSTPIEEKNIVEEDLSQQIDAVRLDDTETDKVGYEANKGGTLFSADDGEDFFNNLPSPKADTPKLTSGDKFGIENSIPSAEENKEEHDGVEESADSSFDDGIQRALVVGDYAGAVAQCISANKMADALVIAHVGGASLWEKTRDQYLKTCHSPYLKIVSAMVNNDLMSLVNTRPLKYWKETLALLCTFAQSEEWSTLCDLLASKLMAAGNTLPATLCYICAGNIDKTVEIWSRSLATEHEGKSYVDLLQDLMEKTIVLALASGQKRFSASLCKLIEKYAEILASQGLLTTAMEYLKLLGSDELSPELIILRDRIALSTEPVDEAKATTLENSSEQSGSVYSQQYYQGAVQARPTGSAIPYYENYRNDVGPAYMGDYNATSYQPTQANIAYQPAPVNPVYQPAPPNNAYQPAPPNNAYQPSPPNTAYQSAPPNTAYQSAPPNTAYQPAQPSMFVPSQAPNVPQATSSESVPQPAVRTFVPSNVTPLRNAEQYQQPGATLGSQLYPSPAPQGPGAAQMASIPGPKMPQVMAPTPTTGFSPVANSVAQRPGVGPVQPPSPQAAAAQPAAPPPTVQTVDTSNVPAHHRPVIGTLTRLFNETSEALGGSRANPGKKREIEGNSMKIGALFAKLNSGDISKNASDKLVQLCQALDKNDFSTALQIQVLLTTSEWDECNFWLSTLKRMIKVRQGVGARS